MTVIRNAANLKTFLLKGSIGNNKCKSADFAFVK
jgi:hypothetical protein